MAKFKLKVNGKSLEVDVDPSTPVLWVIRDHLNLLGTKYGCGIAQCGACTIHMNSAAVRSCVLLPPPLVCVWLMQPPVDVLSISSLVLDQR